MHDLPVSVNDRIISPFREDCILTKLRKFRENKTLAKISEHIDARHHVCVICDLVRYTPAKLQRLERKLQIMTFHLHL